MKKLILLLLSVVSINLYAQQQTINIGASANDHTGDPLRTAFQKTNDNFTELYGAAIPSATAGGTNTYTATPDPPITLIHGKKAIITFSNANTGSSTLNLNGTGAVTIKKFSSGSLVNLSSGDIPAGSMWLVTYDGTNAVYQISIPNNTSGSFWPLSGSATAIGNVLIDDNSPSTHNVLIGSVTPFNSASLFANAVHLASSAVVLDVSNSGIQITRPSRLDTAAYVLVHDNTTGLIKRRPVSSISGSGSVSSIATTSPITGGTITTTGTIGINNAAADGSTKGAASFTANDFDASSGNISIDYTNGQAASGSNKGFLTSSDWTTFNGKQSAITFGTGVQSALGNNIGSAGAPVVFNGAGGTPSSMTGTNITGIPESGVTNLVTDLAAKALKFPTTNTQTTSYTAANTDAGNLIEYNSASPGNITIPPTSTGSWIGDTYLNIVQKGTGAFTVVAGSGVTFTNLSGSLVSPGQGGLVTLKYIGSDVWYVFNGVPSWNPAGSTSITANSTQTGAFTNTFALNGVAITQNNQTGTPSQALTITSGAHTSLTATSTYKLVNIPDYTHTYATGNVVGENKIYFGKPTISAPGASSFLLFRNGYFPKATFSGSATGTATPTTTAGNFGLEVEALRISDAAFTGGGFFYQSANATTEIGGGSSGERITFNGSIITAQQEMWSAQGFVAKTAVSGGAAGAFRSQVPITAASGSTTFDQYLTNTTINTTGTYSAGEINGYRFNPTVTSTITGTGYVNAFNAVGGLTSNSGTANTSNWRSFYSHPVYNTQNAATGGKAYGFYHKPTFTSVTGLTTYGIVIETNEPNGFNVASPTEIVEVGGNVKANHLIGKTSAPTIAAGTGAGTSPTLSVGANSTDMGGYITVTTGTTPSASATVATVTFNTAYGAAPTSVIITPAEGNAAALTGNAQVFVDQASMSTTVFVLKVGSTNLTGATTYKWYYQVIQ